MITITGAILAGGRSVRMGKDKADIVLPSGKTMLSTAANQLSGTAVGRILVSGSQGVPDMRPGMGPLGGIETILHRSLPDAVLFIPCDMPYLKQALLRRMIESWQRSPGRPAVVTSPFLEPLVAVVPVSWKTKVTNAVDAGHLKVGRFWIDCGFTPVRTSDMESLADVDNPWEIPA